MDNEMELEAEFLSEMVIEMQKGATRKARRKVIEQTMGGRSTIQVFNDCLKFHLLTSFILATLLTCGFFKILFLDEEGAITTQKISTVKWCSMNFFFSKYISNFDANAQGVEALLTHTIKVQFLDLQEQFINEKALTIIANKINDVLEIEPTNLYVNKPAGPMITMETCDIIKLTGHICIPSMAKGATPKDTIL